jgi:hypothetical protein
MKRRIGLSAALATLALIGLIACAGSHSQTPPTALKMGPHFVLELKPGEYYKTTTTWFIFKVPIYPQVAAWVETPEGKYLGTIYITGKVAKGSYFAAPKAGRPEALPVWSHLRQGNIDTVSAATSSGKTLRESDLAATLSPGDYVVKLETNRSYDYNEAYTRANAGVCGQPSLVYIAKLHIGDGSVTASFTPIGTGSLDGSDGVIREGLEGITTALDLFSEMRVSYVE